MNIIPRSEYEIMFLLNQEIDQEAFLSFQDEIKKLLKGDTYHFEDLGIKRLAYPIKKKLNARYLLLKTKTKKANIKNFIESIKWNKMIIRYLIINLEKEKHFHYRLKNKEEVKKNYKIK